MCVAFELVVLLVWISDCWVTCCWLVLVCCGFVVYFLDYGVFWLVFACGCVCGGLVGL